MKGHLLTSIVEVLRERKRWDHVFRELSEASRQAVASQPLPSSWMDGQSLAEIHDIVYDLYGSVEVRECSYLSTKRSTVRFLQPFIEATIRIFGVSPHSLLGRIDQFTAQSTKGIHAAYRRLGENECSIELTYPGCVGLSIATLETTAGSLKSVFDFTKTTGVIGPVSWGNSSCNHGEFKIHWRSS